MDDAFADALLDWTDVAEVGCCRAGSGSLGVSAEGPRDSLGVFRGITGWEDAAETGVVAVAAAVREEKDSLVTALQGLD